MDTETGRVWKYEFSRSVKNSTFRTPEYFIYVPVDGINGWNFFDAIKKLAETEADKLKETHKEP